MVSETTPERGCHQTGVKILSGSCCDLSAYWKACHSATEQATDMGPTILESS